MINKEGARDYVGIRKGLKGQSLGETGSANHGYILGYRTAGIYNPSI